MSSNKQRNLECKKCIINFLSPNIGKSFIDIEGRIQSCFSDINSDEVNGLLSQLTSSQLIENRNGSFYSTQEGVFARQRPALLQE